MFTNAFSSGFDPARKSYKQTQTLIEAVIKHIEDDFKDGVTVGAYLKVDGNIQSQTISSPQVQCSTITTNSIASDKAEIKQLIISEKAEFHQLDIKNVIVQENLDIKGWGKFGKHVTATGFYSLSDEKLKKGITYISPEEYDIIKKLKPAFFTYKEDESDKKHIGFIAQDIIQADTSNRYNLVDIDIESGYMQINYSNMIPLIVNKIKSLESKYLTLLRINTFLLSMLLIACIFLSIV